MADIPFDTLIPSASSFKFKQTFTSSGSFTVPEGVYRVATLATGGGGGGGAQSAADNPSGGGGAAASTAISYFDVIPGQVLTITVGAKGLGGVGGVAATAGGSSSVKIGNKLFCHSVGGARGVIPAGGASAAPYCLGFGIFGSSGTSGNTTQTGESTASSIAVPCGVLTPSSPNLGGGALPGNPGAHGSAGGAGGCSFYGVGGNGGNGANSPSTIGFAGQNAPAGNYGAGGGGSGGNGTVSSGTNTGGNGADGIVEILY